MTDDHVHATHPAIIKRLKRAEGHLRGVISMIETRRDCLDVAQQLHAVESAVAAAKRSLIRDHLDHCLEAATDSLPDAQKAAVAAFRDIARYL